MKDFLKILLFIMACFCLSWFIIEGLERCRLPKDCRNGVSLQEIRRDTIYLHDTITEVEPVAASIVATEIRNRKLPVAKPHTIYLNFPEIDTPKDSVEVEVPITQAEYKDSLYQAWVSGYEPKLDSIRIFQHREVVTVEKTVVNTVYKNKRWHIGPMVGFGYTPGGFEPFIGIGITYSLIGF